MQNLLLMYLTFFFLQNLLLFESYNITIEAKYPRKLRSLFIRGSGCSLNWDKGMEMIPEQTIDGVFKWTYTVNTSNCDDLEIKVLVDDSTWMLGANHHVKMNDSNEKNVDVIFPWFYTYSGALTIINNVYSSELKNFREVIFYTPPSYYENTLKIYKNVLIMHDGQNLFDPKTSAFGTAWMCQDTMNSLIIEGKSDEVLIVGAYNTNDRNNEYTYVYDPSEGFGGKGDLYLDWIQSTLIPLAEKNFRILIQKESLGILGSSLGGLISCYGGWTRSSIYGKVGCMSTSLWWDDQDYQNMVVIESIPASPLPVFYMDSGTSGSLGGEAQCAVYTTQLFEYQVFGLSLLRNAIIYIHTYIHTYKQTYIHIYIHTYIHAYIHTYIYTYIHIYIHTYIHTYIHIYIHKYIHTYIHTHIHTHIHTYIHKYTHT